MKTKRLIYAAVLAILAVLGSCRSHKNNAPVAQEVETSILNTKGDTLMLMYDNTAGTCRINYKGEQIVLERDTTASGLRYSNSNYLYTEWHGGITLKKNGKTVFSNKK